MSLIAFPHSDPKLAAQGFGRFATGGRNGKVIRINTTADPTLTTELIAEYEASGAGSLRWAFTRTYPRIIIPTVSGIVYLTSRIVLGTSNGNFTYCGFTAKGSGLLYANYSIEVNGNSSTGQKISNFIIRGLKGKMGDLTNYTGDSFTSVRSENYIIDRSQFAWGTDETLTAYRCLNSTIQFCMIYEALNDSVHEKGVHGFGGIWGGHNWSSHHNFFGSLNQRTPLVQNTDLISEFLFDHRNNAVWNSGTTGIPARGGDLAQMNFISNSFKSGPGSVAQTHFFQFGGDTAEQAGRMYPYGNKLSTVPSLGLDPQSQKLATRFRNTPITEAVRDIAIVNTMFPIPAGTYNFTETADESDDTIYQYVGPLHRDLNDLAILNDWMVTGTTRFFGLRTGLPGIPDTVSDVRVVDPILGTVIGFPPTENLPYPEHNGDGIPFSYKQANGLSNEVNYGVAGTPETHAYLFHASGYRHVEMYLNSLVEPVVIPPTTYPLIIQSTIGGNVTGISGNYLPSTSIPVTATANSGYSFTRWRNASTNETVSLVANFNFLMPARTTTIQAIFTQIITPEPGARVRGKLKKLGFTSPPEV